MTIVDRTDRTTLETVTFDLYRDIHKAIRAELFAVTAEAGRVDPAQRGAREALSARVRDVVTLLVSHAEHEDAAIGPVLELHLPDLAERVESDHHRLDGRLGVITEIAADSVTAAAASQRRGVHHLYLELASFTGEYLAHQDVEERLVMPALEAAVGVEALFGIHEAIVSHIPPDEMARSLALMLPSMNVDDRTEMLAGMHASAPADVFAGVWALAGSVLGEADQGAVGRRLGIA